MICKYFFYETLTSAYVCSYGNNFANIGNAANVTHGKFLVRYDQDKIGVITDCDDESYDGYIGMPTPYGLGLARVVVTNSTEDLDSAHQLQDQMKATKKPRGGENTAPSLDLNMFNEPAYKPGNGTSFEQAVLRLAATLGPYNEPEVAEDRDWVSRTLRNAGCKDGKWIQPPGTNLTAAVAAANVSVAKLLNQPGNIEQMSNNWIAFEPTIMGNFYSYYQMRYLIASWGYLALTSDQAIYPSLSGIDEIGPNEAILFQFSGRPVLKEEGFWSITAYGADQFFIDNDLNRFTLGDRSEITFPDGTLVYLEGEETEDGPFEILLQPADVQPPDNWTSNWLPAPPGGGSLSFTCKCSSYYGETEDSDGMVQCDGMAPTMRWLKEAHTNIPRPLSSMQSKLRRSKVLDSRV